MGFHSPGGKAQTTSAFSSWYAGSSTVFKPACLNQEKQLQSVIISGLLSHLLLLFIMRCVERKYLLRGEPNRQKELSDFWVNCTFSITSSGVPCSSSLATQLWLLFHVSIFFCWLKQSVKPNMIICHIMSICGSLLLDRFKIYLLPRKWTKIIILLLLFCLLIRLKEDIIIKSCASGVKPIRFMTWVHTFADCLGLHLLLKHHLSCYRKCYIISNKDFVV